MTSGVGEAVALALACYRAPVGLADASRRPLPEDMLVLLRIAAGDQETTARCAEASGVDAGEVHEAAVFFIQQVLFAPGADSFRVLGVAPDAPDVRIKEHYRWLVRWLHPDRNDDEWTTVYADRVNRAWQDLRLPERRAAYAAPLVALAEARRAEATQMADEHWGVAGTSRVLVPALPHDDVDALPPSHPARRLSGRALGLLAAGTMTVLVALWLARAPESPSNAETMAAAEVPPAVATPPWSEGSVDAGIAIDEAVGSLLVEPFPQTVAAPDALESAAEPAPPVAAEPVSGAAPTREAAAAAVVAAAPADLVASPSPGLTETAPRPHAAARPPRVRVSPPAREARMTAPSAPAMPSALMAGAPVLAVAAVAPAAAEMPSANPLAAAPDEAAARALLDQFTAAYAEGDLRRLMRLFARDARNNRGGREAIAYDYQSLFDGSQVRELRLIPTGWMARADGLTLLARYEASVRLADRRRAKRSEGNIRFDLRLEDGQARISEVQHDVD